MRKLLTLLILIVFIIQFPIKRPIIFERTVVTLSYWAEPCPSYVRYYYFSGYNKPDGCWINIGVGSD
jgi:hypothetical protein